MIYYTDNSRCTCASPYASPYYYNNSWLVGRNYYGYGKCNCGCCVDYGCYGGYYY